MHMDVEVMQDYGGPLDPAASSARLAQFMTAYERFGCCRWALENLDGEFLGYVGVMPSEPDHPLGAHYDVGWRLVRHAWGFGYAAEAARAALADFFLRTQVSEVLAYTAAENSRSQAVMQRLNLLRDRSRDFTAQYGTMRWRGLVWVAERTAF